MMRGENEGFFKNGAQCELRGWAIDMHHPESELIVRFYALAGPGQRAKVAETRSNQSRPQIQTQMSLPTDQVGWRLDLDQAFGPSVCNLSPPITVEVLAYSPISEQEYALNGNPSQIGQRDQLPLGFLDEVRLSSCHATGWAGDPDITEPVTVAFYVNGSATQGGTYLGTTEANLTHSQTTLPGNRGFEFAIPSTYCSQGTHTLYAYALGNAQGSYAELSSSPRTFGATAPSQKQFKITNPGTTPLEDLFLVTIPFERNEVTTTSQLSELRVQGGALSLDASETRVLEWYRDSNGNPTSVRLAQMSFKDELGPNETRTYTVVDSNTPKSPHPFELHPDTLNSLSSTTLLLNLQAADGIYYRASVGNVIRSQEGDVLVETPHLKITRNVIYFENSLGQGATYPSVYPGVSGQPRPIAKATIYTTYHSEIPWIDVTARVGNHFLGMDALNGSSDPDLYPLGPIFIRSMSLLSEGMDTIALVNGDWWDMPNPSLNGGHFEASLVSQHAIQDGHSTRLDFRLGYLPSNPTSQDRQLLNHSARSMQEGRAYGLATHTTWQNAPGAAGVLGEISQKPQNATAIAEQAYQRFLSEVNQKKGFLSLLEDVANTAQTGTPRQNHGLAPELVTAIQGDYPLGLQQTIAMGAVQLHRFNAVKGMDFSNPQTSGLVYDVAGLVYGYDARDFTGAVGSFGRKLLYDPIKAGGGVFNPNSSRDIYFSLRGPGDYVSLLRSGNRLFDYEHPHARGIYSAWVVSGDPLFQEMMEMAGHSAMGIMSRPRTDVARAAGSALIVILQAYLATGKPEFKDFLAWKTTQARNTTAANWHPAKQYVNQRNPSPNWSRWNLPNAQYDIDYFMPWQNGFVATAYLSIYLHTGIVDALQFAEEVIQSTHYCTVRDHQDPQFGFVRFGVRYYSPSSLIDKSNGNQVVIIAPSYFDQTSGVKWGTSPAGGAMGFLITPMAYLSEVARTQALKDQAFELFQELVGTSPQWGEKWRSLVPKRVADRLPPR